MKESKQLLSEHTKLLSKVIDTVVPDFRDFRIHRSPEGPLNAVDVYAPTGSKIRAPLPGIVKNAGCTDEAPPDNPGGCQISGFLKLPDGRRMGFVLAHLQRSTFKPAGNSFKKGAILGKTKRWEKHPPGHTHVHWAFCAPADKPEDSRIPPPANIPVVKAFELCGLLGPQSFATKPRRETVRK